MKKAKLMLTAITVLAIAGGALAFKAKNFIKNFCYTTTNLIQVGHTTCPVSFTDAKTTTVQISPTQVYYYTLTNNPAQCSNAATPPVCFTTTSTTLAIE